LPHCIVEYSETLNERINEIICAVHSGAIASALFNEEDIKTRGISYNHYKVGKNRSSFIHVSSRILSGRNIEQKRKLNESIIEKIEQLDLGGCSITAEALDIETESYAKVMV